MASAAKPAKRRLSSYWSKPKNNSKAASSLDWEASDPNKVVLADSQTSAIARLIARPTVDRTEARRIESMMEQAYTTSPTSASSNSRWYESDPDTALSPPNWSPPPPPIAELPVTPESPVELPTTRPRPAKRRRAKTPVRRIGQLETSVKQKKACALDRTLSVNSVAGQYRALVCSSAIASTDSNAAARATAEKMSSLPPLNIGQDFWAANWLESPRQRGQLSPSPVSDDGTLVSFDEDSIYFKPFSTSVTSLPISDDTSQSSDSDVAVKAPEALRFQIGLDLLRGELSSALAGKSPRSDRDAAALQIWVMIEAYEHLRDQIANTTSQTREHEDTTVMFDSWLKTLYEIQQSMAYDAAMSDSEYED